jgi:3-oxoadipate enol-lactonase
MEMLKIKVNNLELAYERSGHGTPLVLVHGYPLDHTIWETIVPFLENDFDLILPDLRGFGESEVSQQSYQLTDMAADIAGLLDTLVIKKALIAGHSMGGYVSLAFASIFPDRIQGLGLVASQAAADSPERKESRAQLAARVKVNGVGEVADSMPPLLTADVALQAKLKQLISRQSPRAVAGNLLAMAERVDSTPLLAGFDFPVAVIHGLKDRILPIERAREVKSMVKHGTLTEIAEAGHMPMIETPEKTAEALEVLI